MIYFKNWFLSTDCGTSVSCHLRVRLWGKSVLFLSHKDCSSVDFYADRQSYPSRPLHPNYEANQYVDCYRMLTCFQKDITVNQNDYVKGVYYSFNSKSQGHRRLEMKFAKAYLKASP